MNGADWRTLSPGEGVFVEHSPADGRSTWWVPAGGDEGFRYWRQVGADLAAEVSAGDGFLLTPATSCPVRRPRGGDPAESPGAAAPDALAAVAAPNAGPLERCGPERSDLVLLRAAPDSDPVDPGRIRARWPTAEPLREIADGLFLVSGVVPDRADPGKDVTELLECPRARGAQLLASARESGDRRAEAAALTDLAVMSMNEGDSRRALDRLKEALQITRDVGDRKGETDVTGNFGLLSLTIGNPGLASQLFERELEAARACGDRFAEKSALEHLGLARGRLGDRSRSLDFFEQALSLARAAGDRQHEFVLTWHQAVQHAELGQRDRAVAKANSAIDLARELDAQQAEILAAHLRRYLDQGSGTLAAGPGAHGPASAVVAESIVVSAGVDAGPSASERGEPGPGLLRSGLSAARSVTRFLASGMKLTDAAALQTRLRACADCEHHTGLRCKVCGCFTNVKTRMAVEKCPAGKWPA
jgi:tetratricopeptide (TPR) repeat protein